HANALSSAVGEKPRILAPNHAIAVTIPRATGDEVTTAVRQRLTPGIDCSCRRCPALGPAPPEKTMTPFNCGIDWLKNATCALQSSSLGAVSPSTSTYTAPTHSKHIVFSGGTAVSGLASSVRVPSSCSAAVKPPIPATAAARCASTSPTISLRN